MEKNDPEFTIDRKFWVIDAKTTAKGARLRDLPDVHSGSFGSGFRIDAGMIGVRRFFHVLQQGPAPA